MKSFALTAILIISMSTAANSQNSLRSCLSPPETDCRGYSVSVPFEFINMKCPMIEPRDQELFMDVVQCRGKTFCWLMHEDNDRRQEGHDYSNIVYLTNRLLMTPLDIAMEKEESSSQGPTPEEACPLLQRAIDRFLPILIEDLSE